MKPMYIKDWEKLTRQQQIIRIAMQAYRYIKYYGDIPYLLFHWAKND